mmetsp:Transcript_31125/g.81049  ORF Transcript_31125/g.81049 Transcript_31125/m.81049 type:complete len:155 (-) Transcript_31125:1024-1488(-)
MRTHQKQAQQSTHSSMSYHSQQGQAPQAPPVPRHHNNSLVSLSASTHLYACTLGKPHSPLLLLLLLLPLPLLLRTGPGLGETRSSLLTVIVPSLCWTTAFTLLSLFALAGLPRVLLLALLLAGPNLPGRGNSMILLGSDESNSMSSAREHFEVA